MLAHPYLEGLTEYHSECVTEMGQDGERWQMEEPVPVGVGVNEKAVKYHWLAESSSERKEDDCHDRAQNGMEQVVWVETEADFELAGSRLQGGHALCLN